MLQIENLCAGYDRTERLHGVSARLHPGRLTAIVGPNGCGKSTLLKCAVGVHPVSSGEIRLNGRALTGIAEKERARIVSYMPQFRTAPEISVHRLAAHGRYPHLKWGQNLQPADRAIIEESLRRTELLPLSDRIVSQLSGGERQRAYLAMMLAQQTPVMLLDEPTTYLDLSTQFSMMELLRELSREDRCIAVVLHDLSMALEYADDVLLMQEGRLIAEGSPEEVYRSGQLQSVFGVEIERTAAGRYLFSRRTSEACP